MDVTKVKKPPRSHRWSIVQGLSVLLPLLMGIALTPPLCGEQATKDPINRYEAKQEHMGTLFRIVVYATDATARKAIPQAFQRIAEIDQKLSNYKKESELSQLSSKIGKRVSVSDDLWSVLKLSRTVHQQSNGSFDVALGPITKVWLQARRTKILPTPDVVAKALHCSGTNLLEFNDVDKTVQLTRAGMALDPGGVAKGWAVQQAIDVLRDHGILSALVDGGGDMFMMGRPQSRESWRIAVAPLRPGGKPTTIVGLVDRAIATSGDAWQYLEVDGRRYSHIVDPKTGMGVTIPCSVTVISKDGGTADAWASAISVLGPKAGLKTLARRKDLEALVVYVDEQGDVQQETSAGFHVYQVAEKK
jgi:thiamine biosynthesis lipoprotein